MRGLVGLLGPNGAGKSTFMRMLATITKPTDGTITWNGADIVKSPDILRDVLGYLPQDFGVYPNLSAIEFLEYMAAIKGLDAVESHKVVYKHLNKSLIKLYHLPIKQRQEENDESQRTSNNAGRASHHRRGCGGREKQP